MNRGQIQLGFTDNIYSINPQSGAFLQFENFIELQPEEWTINLYQYIFCFLGARFLFFSQPECCRAWHTIQYDYITKVVKLN